ncbi:MCM family protein [Halodesulfurarchaeum formicicum]|uniref:DNA helicase n=2 Tax=Halodesulfurarchaeum formicicum TaxID=1873524 RepID=A0A1D8S1R9_9EURY|nr:MCM family protein [Halodesulfurarchaeum formicicum]
MENIGLRMASARDQELTDRFETFYRQHESDAIADLARKYPREDKSLEIDWQDLFRFDPDFAEDVISSPRTLLDAAEEALGRYDLPVDKDLSGAHVRVVNLPEATEIRAIRAEHLGTLVSVQGIVRKATSVKPKIERAAFECLRCGTITVVPQADGDFQDPYQCDGCEREGPFQFLTDHGETEFVDAQKLRIQESPEGLAGGETPENIDMHIEDDITGEVSPGDHVTATGILRLDDSDMESTDSRVFDMYLEGVDVVVEDEEFEEMEISDAEREEIIRLSEQPDIYEQLVDSVAPTIYGFDVAKLAIGLQLFSGVTKHLPDGARIRGDVHILLVGDPGTGKSQILQYIRHIAPRSVYTSGKGSSSAGLTAAAVRDDFGEGQQWSLEAGALVLADKGIAAVDELDKMACVTGDTLVSLGDGELERIGELSREAAAEGSIEELENGRTIRDVPDLSVRTMTEDGSIEKRPVTAIHEYDAPSELCEVRLESGESLIATPDHPFFVFEAGERKIREAAELDAGTAVFVPQASTVASDGGARTLTNPTAETDLPLRSDVELATVKSVRVRPRADFPETPQHVYDLTVEGTHNFVANGMVVHNSDDRSAMHEALEQQSYHPNTEILLADGRRVEIGDFVDEQMAAREDEIVDGVDCEILPVDDLSVHSTDIEEGETTKLPVDRVSRHEAPDEFVRVTFSNGRDVLVTPEHPMFVAEDGSIETVEAAQLEAGSPVPAPVDWASSDREAMVAADGGGELPAGFNYHQISNVETVPNEGEHATDWVYDVTVEPTNTFVSNGVILHNSISISKAGINATLKSRCSLLGAANPELGRFDRYETPAEQIDLEPALISRFDLIFTVTDDPDEEKDANLAEHILNTNYAGELNTHRTKVNASNVSEAEVAGATESVAPAIEPELMRKYIAYARSTCFPTMTEEAEERIREFYVNLRSQGTGEDSPVPVTARKLEAIVRLAEASARVRLSDTVELEDADRSLEIVEKTLKEIGMDPETGQYDADVIETGQSKSQRDRIRTIRELIADIEADFDEGAPIDEVLARAEEVDMDRSKAEHEIEKLKQKGEVYEPTNEHLRTT